MRPRLLALAAFTLVCTAAHAGPCKVPAFKGVPTGEAAFNVSGDAIKGGTIRYLNFGDELLVGGGEGGLWAISLFAEDACGLWLQRARGGSYAMADTALRLPKYEPFKGTAGRYTVTLRGVKFELKRVLPGRFEVKLITPIQAYIGE